jgi:hypothetical protein
MDAVTGNRRGDIDAFVADMERAFERAWSSGGHLERHALRLAGLGVEVRVAGRRLAQILTPALAHATHPHGEPSLRVGCWDRSVTGVAPPAPPLSLDDYLPRGVIRGQANDRVRVTYDRWMRMLCVYDRDRGEAFVHVADSHDVPAWVNRAPLRSILTWWAADRGFAFLHASAVASPSGAAVIAGASGSGKSTTALTCVSDGMQFLGDDACLVRFEPAPEAWAVYGLAKLERDAFARLHRLHHLAVEAVSSHAVLDPTRHLGSCAELRAVLLVSVGSTPRTSLKSIARSDALRSLVAGSVLEGGGSNLAGLARLVREVPCYRVELGSDPEDVVAAVREAIAQ